MGRAGEGIYRRRRPTGWSICRTRELCPGPAAETGWAIEGRDLRPGKQGTSDLSRKNWRTSSPRQTAPQLQLTAQVPTLPEGKSEQRHMAAEGCLRFLIWWVVSAGGSWGTWRRRKVLWEICWWLTKKTAVTEPWQWLEPRGMEAETFLGIVYSGKWTGNQRSQWSVLWGIFQFGPGRFRGVSCVQAWKFGIFVFVGSTEHSLEAHGFRLTVQTRPDSSESGVVPGIRSIPIGEIFRFEIWFYY